MESCDAAAFITPLYWLGFPAQLKAPIDKLYAYGERYDYDIFREAETAVNNDLCEKPPSLNRYLR